MAERLHPFAEGAPVGGVPFTSCAWKTSTTFFLFASRQNSGSLGTSLMRVAASWMRIGQTPHLTLHGPKDELAARGVKVSHNAVWLYCANYFANAGYASVKT